MTSRAARVAVVPSALSLLVLACPASYAQSLTLDDPTGDAPAGELDITSATVMNRDHRVIAQVTTADLTRGHVIVSLDRRSGEGVRLVSSRRADGTVNGRILAGAFTDRTDGGVVPCRGYDVRWDDDTEAVTLSMPSRCWNSGDFGALRFVVLSEASGGDSDLAPQTEDGGFRSSAWVPRG